MSGTFFPSSGLTLGVVFGCSPEQRNSFVNRLRNSDDVFLHPLLAVGILCELEKERIFAVVDKIFDRFAQDSVRLIDGSQPERWLLDACGKESRQNSGNANHLCERLDAVQRDILMRVITLSDDLLSPQIHDLPTSALLRAPDAIYHGRQLVASGKRIKLRLQAIHDQVQGKIKKCETKMREEEQLLQKVSPLSHTSDV